MRDSAAIQQHVQDGQSSYIELITVLLLIIVAVLMLITAGHMSALCSLHAQPCMSVQLCVGLGDAAFFLLVLLQV
jgi:hypothetical protein